MNYIAHLLLSSNEDEHLIIGNFVADFLTLHEQKLLPESYQKGIYFHRKIDQFTDSHSRYISSSKRLHVVAHKYSPVIVDIYYDFLLRKHWDEFSKTSFENFKSFHFELLQKHKAIFPNHVEHLFLKMIEGDFMSAYNNYEGLEFVFKKLEKRTKFSLDVASILSFLKNNESTFDEDFHVFFPDIITTFIPKI